MRGSRLFSRWVALLVCAGVLTGSIAVAAAAVKPAVSSLRAKGGTVTVRVNTPTSVNLSIYQGLPVGCRKPYCVVKLVTTTTQRVGREGLRVEFGQALPAGTYLVIAVAVVKHRDVSQPRYATVTIR